MSVVQRPNPDELLRRVVEQEQKEKRGKLTLFFGAAPGVGKTYAMLEVARAEMEREKRDVVVGLVEAHGRYETAALLLGLELLPRRKVEYKGVVLEELDLDAALARRPDLILVDELAHTNAPGSRHPKRWQDVEELLDAGIDVFSTMNVQHVESLNDVIAKITGVVVRETVPDSMLERAHELKLVDLPPDDLLERLREGKVYVPSHAQRAIENFFRKGNLIALRELSLRHAAERVDAQMRAFRRAHGIEQTWSAAEHILVAVGPSPSSARLVRTARRMAGALHARWFAVYVEPERAVRLSRVAAERLARNLRLAEQLGAEVIWLSGDEPSEALVAFAREHEVTKIVVGKPVIRPYRPWERLRPSLVDRILRISGDIDVYVTTGDPAPGEDAPALAPHEHRPVPALAAALGAALVSTLVASAFFGRQQLADAVMVYLLGVILISVRFGFGTSMAAALLSVGAFDFFFIPPYHTFAIADVRHVVTFFVMFLVAVVISGLTQRIRHQALAARERERRTAALYALSRELTVAQGIDRVLTAAAGHLQQQFGSRVIVFLPDAKGRLERADASAGQSEAADAESSISQWVWAHQKEAGLGTSTLPAATALYVPLLASGGIVGVLGLAPDDPARFEDIEARRQVDAFASQMAQAIERATLAQQAEQARLQVETEQLRSSLLSSVSHDLRTPLAVITGAASTLLDTDRSVDEATRGDLLETIFDEAERLNRLIRNLLDMTRLESGAVQVKKEWVPLEEVVGSAVNRLEARLGTRELRIELAPELPLLPIDSTLIEVVLINLLENAAKYSEGAIELNASMLAGEAMIEVADRGAGVPAGEELRVFDKFHRAVREGSPTGVGLGLAISRAIVAAHGGRIGVERRDGGGAAFRFTLPLTGAQPALTVQDDLNEIQDDLNQPVANGEL